MKEYVARSLAAVPTAADPVWETIPAVALDFVWENSFPSPYATFARLVHSPEGLTVRFETDEWPLRACHTVANEQICEDSCMEFFFTPNTEDVAYINIEVNPIGVPHVGIGTSRYDRRLLDVAEAGLRIETSVTYGRGWTITLHVPYTFIDRHFTSRGREMRANFYKCGDKTVRKHFSVWSPIGTEKSDYHQPSFFGKIVLE